MKEDEQIEQVYGLVSDPEGIEDVASGGGSSKGVNHTDDHAQQDACCT